MDFVRSSLLLLKRVAGLGIYPFGTFALFFIGTLPITYETSTKEVVHRRNNMKQG